ncbi:MAG: hypothetical protein PHN63_04515 [Candidatus Omnitrophica bacterium]|nr:hypothetical protein [Candidatus Omnitrophota bacterium]
MGAKLRRKIFVPLVLSAISFFVCATLQYADEITRPVAKVDAKGWLTVQLKNTSEKIPAVRVIANKMIGAPQVLTINNIAFLAPTTGDFVSGLFEIRGTIDTPAAPASYYEIKYAYQDDPDIWYDEGITIERDGTLLARWDTNGLNDGDIILKITVKYASGSESSGAIRVAYDHTLLL